MVAAHHDQQLEEAILTTLNQARLPDVEMLRVLVVAGVAYIDGCVSNYRAKKVISGLVASVPGLGKVVNRSRVVPAAVVRDESLAERVRWAIQSHSSLRDQAISVRSRDSIVELSGKVSRVSLRLQAEDAAWSVSGVRQVVNRLQVSPVRLPGQQNLVQHLEEHLQCCLGIEPWQISVEVEEEVAYLRGKVPSQALSQVAEELVRWHPQIRDVVNRLIVEEAPSARDYHLTA